MKNKIFKSLLVPLSTTIPICSIASCTQQEQYSFKDVEAIEWTLNIFNVLSDSMGESMEALLAKLRSWAISKIGEEFEEIIDQVISSLKESLNWLINGEFKDVFIYIEKALENNNLDFDKKFLYSQCSNIKYDYLVLIQNFINNNYDNLIELVDNIYSKQQWSFLPFKQDALDGLLWIKNSTYDQFYDGVKTHWTLDNFWKWLGQKIIDLFGEWGEIFEEVLGPEHARTTFEALINIGGWAHDIFNARENEDPFGTKETTRLRIASNQLSYSKYDYDKLQPGDIVHFRNGGFVQKIVGGHTAIIIGKKTNKCSDNQQAEYWQILESDSSGVQFGAIDDNVIEENGIVITRPNWQTSEIANNVVNFMQSQIGLSYNIPAFLIRGVKQPYKSWYCSELVWDAYNLQGHDIQNYDWMQNKPLKSEPGPTPSNLFHYSDVKIILDANKPL